MMRGTIILVLVLVLAAACGKKPSVDSQPSGAVSSEPSEEEPFVLSAPAKKQAKYFPEGTPSRAIQDLDDTLDSYILSPRTPEEKKYNQALKRHVIHGTFDIRELCRLALDKHWNERSAGEQDYFVDLMTRLLEKKAVFSKEQGQKKQGTKTLYKISYEGDRFLNPEKTQSLAMSMVHIPSEDLKIELNYKLKKADESAEASGGGGWMIYDVIVDGASLLDNYKYQFDKIIAKDGYPTLIRRMESKMKELEEKDRPAEKVGG